jgi:hypothetical protein
VTDERDLWSLHHFTVTKTNGTGQPSDVPTLLEAVADHLRDLGKVTVHDVTFRTDVGIDGPDMVAMTVYYERLHS